VFDKTSLALVELYVPGVFCCLSRDPPIICKKVYFVLVNLEYAK